MKNKKSPVFTALYILTAVFVVFWSVWKYNLGVNKNFFFGLFAVIGVIYLLFSIAIRMNRKIRAEKIDLCGVSSLNNGWEDNGRSCEYSGRGRQKRGHQNNPFNYLIISAFFHPVILIYKILF